MGAYCAGDGGGAGSGAASRVKSRSALLRPATHTARHPTNSSTIVTAGASSPTGASRGARVPGGGRQRNRWGFPLLAALAAGAASPAADWPEARGPSGDGRSEETSLPRSWSPDGENLLFRVPYGGRSTPVVLDGRLFLQSGSGQEATRQSQLAALDAATGEALWTVRRNIFHADSPPHRVGWPSPAADAETGTVFYFTVGGELLALDAADGEVRWSRSLPEELGYIATYGGRTPSPTVVDDLVILSGVSSLWGAHAPGRQRFFAFDKRTGRLRWLSSPGERPFDTTYSPPSVRNLNGRKTLLVGGGDGAFHALEPSTGASVWRFPMSKRGVNSGALVIGDLVVVSHGEENIDSSVMGLLAGLDAASSGLVEPEAARWRIPGFLGGYSSGVTDGERIYWMDNSANLSAFRANDASRLWTRNLGTIQRASPVLADGNLYVGTVNGRFFILRPGEDGVEVLDEDLLGTEDAPEEIFASAAVSDGVVYLVSSARLYAIGERRAEAAAPAPEPPAPSASAAAPARLVLSPTEEILAPGGEIELTARAFDAAGLPVEAPGGYDWSVDGLPGEVTDGILRIREDASAGAGTVAASAGGLRAEARFRVTPPLPWAWDFDAEDSEVPREWVNATGKYAVRTLEDGARVLVKRADNPFLRRARVYMGPPSLSGYRVSADVLARMRRRQLGNAGLVAQRYQLVLKGTHQRLEIHSWTPTEGRITGVPFPWEPDTWYSMEFEVVEDEAGVVARGRVWPRSETKPSDWSIEWRESLPHRQGTPGIFADAVSAEIFFDNLRVEPAAEGPGE